MHIWYCCLRCVCTPFHYVQCCDGWLTCAACLWHRTMPYMCMQTGAFQGCLLRNRAYGCLLKMLHQEQLHQSCSERRHEVRMQLSFWHCLQMFSPGCLLVSGLGVRRAIVCRCRMKCLICSILPARSPVWFVCHSQISGHLRCTQTNKQVLLALLYFCLVQTHKSRQ